MTRTKIVRRDEPTLDQAALAYLGLHADDPATRALAAVADRFKLDPLLGEVILVPGRGQKPAAVYVSKDGMLRWAHSHPQLAGIEVDHEEGDSGWRAEARVHRSDWVVPAVGRGGCGKKEHIAQQGHGPEMAEARALRRALKLAFALPSSEEPSPDDVLIVNNQATGHAYIIDQPVDDGPGKMLPQATPLLDDTTVDVDTGEILNDPDADPLASIRATILERLTAFEAEGVAVKEQWKQAGLSKVADLTSEQLPAVETLMGLFDEQRADLALEEPF